MRNRFFCLKCGHTMYSEKENIKNCNRCGGMVVSSEVAKVMTFKAQPFDSIDKFINKMINFTRHLEEMSGRKEECQEINIIGNFNDIGLVCNINTTKDDLFKEFSAGLPFEEVLNYFMTTKSPSINKMMSKEKEETPTTVDTRNLVAEHCKELLKLITDYQFVDKDSQIKVSKMMKDITDILNEDENKKIERMIDQTILKPETTLPDITTFCEDAEKHEYASVCVNPMYVKPCADLLSNSKVKVCTVISFPLGANTIEQKVLEATNACQNGADELDYVINIGAVKYHNWDYIEKEMRAMVEFQKTGKIVKVILETCLLTKDEIKKVCQIARELGISFVKTSTGFSTGGATVEVVKLMADTVKGSKTQVKASGGIRTKEDAIAMIKAGATRIGTSNGAKLIEI